MSPRAVSCAPKAYFLGGLLGPKHAAAIAAATIKLMVQKASPAPFELVDPESHIDN